MIEYIKNPIIAFLLYSSLLMIITYIINVCKRKKVLVGKLIITLLSVIVVAYPLVFKMIEKELFQIPFLDANIISNEGVLALLNALLLVIYLFTFVQKDKSVLYKESINSVSKKVYAYLDKNGKVLNFTSTFFDEINVYKKEQNKWYKQITNIYYNSQEITYKQLLAKFKDNDELEFKLSFVIDDEELSFNIQKIAVEVEEKLIGYILVQVEESTKENLVDGFSLVIDNLEVPYAYHNEDAKSNSSIIYNINKKFKDLLGIRGRTVTYNELRYLVYKEDIDIFERAASEIIDKENDTYQYRLRTNQGIKLFTEIKLIKNDHITSIVTLAEERKQNLVSKKELFELVDNHISNKESFGGIIVSLNSFVEIFNTRGSDVAKELVNKYVGYVQREILKDNDLICKISDIEYLLLINNVSYLDKIVRDVVNNVSVLTKYEFKYGEETLVSSNTLGVVYYDQSIKSSQDFMSDLDSALAFANSADYTKNYSIYSPKAKEIEKKVTTDIKVDYKEYSFDKYKIDLDNSFLNDDEDK